MKDLWPADYLLLRRYIVRAKGQSGKDANIIIFLPLPILDPWGTMTLTSTLLKTVYPFKIIPSDTLQPLQPKDETTTKLQRKQEGINQVSQVNTPLFEFPNLDPVFPHFCVIW